MQYRYRTTNVAEVYFENSVNLLRVSPRDGRGGASGDANRSRLGSADQRRRFDATVTDPDNSFRCIYCGRSKPGAESSLEHIWPQGLGGNYAPGFFQTRDVCKTCNNLVGLFVDGEYQRSFFMGVESISAALRFLDDTRPVALPLVFMGIHPAPHGDQEICEQWLGPRGEKIFFFHGVDRDDFRTYAGGDPIRRRKRDPGRVYLSFARANIFWVDTVMLSARAYFPRAELRLLTVTNAPHLLEQSAAETDQSKSDRAYLEPVWREKAANVGMTLSLDHALRFQAKLALGFGHALFGAAFAELPYEETLRGILWERESARRAEFPRIGSSIFSPPESDPIIDRLAYPGAFTLLFNGSRDGVFLTVFSPGGRRLDTQIALAPVALPSGLLQDHLGSFVVLIVPARAMAVGPIPIGHYTMHRFGSSVVPELARLDSFGVSIEALEQRLRRYDIAQPDPLASDV